MENIAEIMIMLIKCAVVSEVPDVALLEGLSVDDMVALFKLSRDHDMTHLVGTSLIKSGVKLHEKLKARYENNIYALAYRCEQLKFTFDSTASLFEEEKIPFIPLKGTVIRQMYPQGWMRTSCDIDILVSRDDHERAGELLCKRLSYKRQEAVTKHDITYTSPEGINLELHYDLLDEDTNTPQAKMLKSAWEHSSPIKDGGCERRLSDAMLYFYHISHMAKHFADGGCGVKPLLDLWMIEKNIDITSDEVRAMIRDGGLEKFAVNAEHLSRVWFSGCELDDTTRLMQDFIMKGGVFGNRDTRYMFTQKELGGKRKYFVSRIFLPYEEMKHRYPKTKKHKILVPFCQIHRWFSLLLGKNRKFRKKYMQSINNMSNEEISSFETLIDRVGLS